MRLRVDFPNGQTHSFEQLESLQEEKRVPALKHRLDVDILEHAHG